MASQMVSGVPFEQFLGGSTSSESSLALHVGKDSPHSNPLTLGSPLVNMESLSAAVCSNSILNKISERVHDASQVPDRSSQAIHGGSGLSRSISCQQVLPDFSDIPTKEENPFGECHSSSPEQGLDSTREISVSCEQQSVQIHEETGTGCVSDHFNVHSSSQPAQTEYSQSDPYSAPATIFRAHSSDLRTNVVGIQEPASSSPPSSPSMNSNYVPSSSPIPSSSSVEGRNQTPPSSPPAAPEHYVHDAPAGIQESFYGNDDYSAFAHTIDHRSYEHLEQHDSRGFYLSVPHQHSDAISSPLLSPSFMPSYYAQAQEAPGPTEQYMQNQSIALYAPESPQPTPGPSDRVVETETTAESSKSSQAVRKNVMPNPKRPTLAGVRLQQKKLSKPFRSPIIHPPVRLAPKPPTVPSEPLVSSANSAYLKEASPAKSTEAAASSSQKTSDPKIKHRTTRAASQFKSPLASSSTISDDAALVRLTPTIQSLERKLQLLRRALKVREDAQEEVLDGLVNKWTEAGREVAQEVWDVVKDNADQGEGSGGGERKGKKRAIEESWGWDESGESKKSRQGEGERNWGWDVVPASDRSGKEVEGEGGGDGDVGQTGESQETNEEVPPPSLGTMLMELGIAPETLGWNEEEGTFVDSEQGRKG